MAENMKPNIDTAENTESTIDTAENTVPNTVPTHVSESVRFYIHARGSGQINMKTTLAATVFAHLPTGTDLHATFNIDKRTLTIRAM